MIEQVVTVFRETEVDAGIDLIVREIFESANKVFPCRIIGYARIIVPIGEQTGTTNKLVAGTIIAPGDINRNPPERVLVIQTREGIVSLPIKQVNRDWLVKIRGNNHVLAGHASGDNIEGLTESATILEHEVRVNPQHSWANRIILRNILLVATNQDEPGEWIVETIREFEQAKTLTRSNLMS